MQRNSKISREVSMLVIRSGLGARFLRSEGIPTLLLGVAATFYESSAGS